MKHIATALALSVLGCSSPPPRERTHRETAAAFAEISRQRSESCGYDVHDANEIVKAICDAVNCEMRSTVDVEACASALRKLRCDDTTPQLVCAPYEAALGLPGASR